MVRMLGLHWGAPIYGNDPVEHEQGVATGVRWVFLGVGVQGMRVPVYGVGLGSLGLVV